MNTKEFLINVETEIKKTEALIEEYKSTSNPIAPDDAIGRLSRMDAINNRSVMEAALRQAREKLTNLKNIRSRIGEPDFGICRKCKQPIPVGRILIRPESQHCVNCAR